MREKNQPIFRSQLMSNKISSRMHCHSACEGKTVSKTKEDIDFYMRLGSLMMVCTGERK